ncbi:MAG: alpha/beta fold hydrolase [Mycobacterium sp.]|nr:alpha/beta fold hydrolase [Mycobacterium sp.]
MTKTSQSRIRLTHHIVEFDDGRQVGLSVGGRGVPLVFMHGLLLSRRAYLRLLSRIAGMGFLVVAVDAAGHGDTWRLPKDACGFTDRADSVLRTLDALGVGQAVFVGHSMGGRMTIQLAARAPERVLAAVLFDPAAGARFDNAIPHLVKSPGKGLGAAFTAIRDTLGDPTRLETGEQVGYLRLLASVATPNLRNPLGAIRTIKAIIESGDYTPMLHTMRSEGMPTMVVHGEKDMIVPFGCAREIADDCDGTLYKVPDAYHSWMIANPRHGADAFRQLLDGELGEVIRNAADTIGIEDVDDHAAWERELLDPDALLFKFIDDGITEIGVEEPQHVKLELIRHTQRTHERMSWARRTYRRWAAKHLNQTRSVIRQNTRIRPEHRY